MPKKDKPPVNETLSAFLALIQNLPTRQEFTESFGNVVKNVKQFEAKLVSDFSALRDTIMGLQQRVEDKVDAKLADHDTVIKTRLAEIKQPEPGKDGYTPIKGVDYFDGEPGEDADPADEAALVAKIEADLPSLGNAIRDGLELLKDDERLKVTALSGLEEEIRRLAAEFEGTGTTTGWGAHPLTIRGLGINIDKNTRVIDFRGAGLTSVTRSKDGVVTVTVGGGSGTLSPIAVTGTIDDSNVTFTVASTPTFLVINGSIYQSTGGNITWSLSSSTLTLSSPVGSSGSIYGL